MTVYMALISELFVTVVGLIANRRGDYGHYGPLTVPLHQLLLPVIALHVSS